MQMCARDVALPICQVRLALRDAVEVAHAELNILVGDPAEDPPYVIGPRKSVRQAGRQRINSGFGCAWGVAVRRISSMGIVRGRLESRSAGTWPEEGAQSSDSDDVPF